MESSHARAVVRTLWRYNDGGCSVQDILSFVTSYRGSETHLLWETHRSVRLIAYCFEDLADDKLLELVQALLSDDPQFLLRQRQYDGSFLHVAFQHAYGRAHSHHDGTTPLSVPVLLRLCSIPAATRLRGRCHYAHGYDYTPLHCACAVPDIEPDVVNRLIDWDPDVLLIPAGDSHLPIHCAVSENPLAPFVRRMMELRPESLLLRDFGEEGRTPLLLALQSRAPTPPRRSAQVASLAMDMVALRPESVRPASSSMGRLCAFETALFHACRNYPEHPALIRAIAHAWPAALCIAAHRPLRNDGVALLPLEIAQQSEHPAPATVAFLRAETLHMALAAVELATSSASFEGDPAAAPAEAAFQRHVKETVARFLLAERHVQASSSGLEVAQALRHLVDSPVELCRALFLHEETRSLVHADGRFREAVLGGPVSGLYVLNRRGGRFRMSPSHQVELLALVKDDLNCIFLQYRGFAFHALHRCYDNSTGRDGAMRRPRRRPRAEEQAVAPRKSHRSVTNRTRD